MNIENKNMTDVFSWIKSAVLVSLPNSIFYGLYLIILYLVVGAFLYLSYKGIILGFESAVKMAGPAYFKPIMIAVPTVSMLIVTLVVVTVMLGNIKSSQDMIYFDNVSLSNFFFAFKNPGILLKVFLLTLSVLFFLSLIAFLMYLGLSMYLELHGNRMPGAAAFFIMTHVSSSKAVFYTTFAVTTALGTAISVYMNSIVTLLLQRREPKLVQSIQEATKGLVRNFLPFAVLTVILALFGGILGYATDEIINSVTTRIKTSGIDSQSIMIALLGLALHIIGLMIFVSAVCIACEDIFKEDEDLETEQSVDDSGVTVFLHQ